MKDLLLPVHVALGMVRHQWHLKTVVMKAKEGGHWMWALRAPFILPWFPLGTCLPLSFHSHFLTSLSRALYPYLPALSPFFRFFWRGPFLKSLLNLLRYCFCFLFWFFGHEACGILVPQPGIKPAPPALEVQSPNHWTAREVPFPPFIFLAWTDFIRV